MSGAVTHPRAAARRGAVRARSWWGKAWLRAVEESAYAEADLRAGRRLARSGDVGAITVDTGSFVAAVVEGDDAWTVHAQCEPAGPWEVFIELVAAAAGRVGALLAGDLPHELVEQAEDAGFELLPYAGDLSWTCTCDPWTPPCRHALAVAHQLGWLLDTDPFVLVQLRGLTREDLLARLHASRGELVEAGDACDLECSGEDDPDLEVALEAADRARRALDLLAEGRSADHLF